MKILIVAATFDEIQKLVDSGQNRKKTILKSTIPNVDILVTGIGIAATIFNLTKCLTINKFDLVINAGICGSYNNEIELGSVIEVVEDFFTDRVVETGNGIMSWNEAGLNAFDKTIEHTSCLNATLHTKALLFRHVKSITSDTVHANPKTIYALKLRFNPDVESMEGAAVFYVCKLMKIKAMQLRAVSNAVGVRKKTEWKTELAIKNLSIALKNVIREIRKEDKNINFDKNNILNNVGYTDFVYDRINKKLKTNYTKDKIEEIIRELIVESNNKDITQKGKNIYIINTKRKLRITINSNTLNIITVDRTNKMQ